MYFSVPLSLTKKSSSRTDPEARSKTRHTPKSRKIIDTAIGSSSTISSLLSSSSFSETFPSSSLEAAAVSSPALDAHIKAASNASDSGYITNTTWEPRRAPLTAASLALHQNDHSPGRRWPVASGGRRIIRSASGSRSRSGSGKNNNAASRSRQESQRTQQPRPQRRRRLRPVDQGDGGRDSGSSSSSSSSEGNDSRRDRDGRHGWEEREDSEESDRDTIIPEDITRSSNAGRCKKQYRGSEAGSSSISINKNYIYNAATQRNRSVQRPRKAQSGNNSSRSTLSNNNSAPQPSRNAPRNDGNYSGAESSLSTVSTAMSTIEILLRPRDIHGGPGGLGSIIRESDDDDDRDGRERAIRRLRRLTNAVQQGLRGRQGHQNRQAASLSREIEDVLQHAERLLRQGGEGDRGGGDNNHDINEDMLGRTALHRATQRLDVITMTRLIRAGAALNTQDNDGNTALLTVNYSGDDKQVTRAVQCLLTAGASAVTVTHAGETALHRAAAAGHLAAVELLLHHGAVVDVRCARGYTPMHEACVAAHHHKASITKALLARGANEHALTDRYPRGWSPFDLCLKSLRRTEEKLVTLEFTDGIQAAKLYRPCRSLRADLVALAILADRLDAIMLHPTAQRALNASWVLRSLRDLAALPIASVRERLHTLRNEKLVTPDEELYHEVSVCYGTTPQQYTRP